MLDPDGSACVCCPVSSSSAFPRTGEVVKIPSLALDRWDESAVRGFIPLSVLAGLSAGASFSLRLSIPQLNQPRDNSATGSGSALFPFSLFPLHLWNVSNMHAVGGDSAVYMRGVLPFVELSDSQGFSVDLRSTGRTAPAGGETQPTLVASILIFGNGKDHHVIWQAP